MTLGAKVSSLFALAALACGLSGCTENEPLEVSPQVDYDRFSGRWYEIAHLPRPTQQDCYGTTSFYERSGADSLRVVHECALGRFDGPYHGMETSAIIPNASEPAKLSLKINLYRGDYWILEVDDRYEHAVVGHPSRDYLWILSRTPQLEPATLQGILDRAKAKKFDIDRLEYTPQGAAHASSGLRGDPPPDVDYGSCGIGRRSGAPAAAATMAIALALTALVRRRQTPRPS